MMPGFYVTCVLFLIHKVCHRRGFLNGFHFILMCRFSSRLIICKTPPVLTYRSRGLIRKLWRLLVRHLNWVVHTQLRFCLEFCLYSFTFSTGLLWPLIVRAGSFVVLSELSADHFGKITCNGKKLQWNSCSTSCKVAGTCGIYTISGIYYDWMG